MLQMVLPVFTQVIVDRVLVEQDVSLLRLLIVAMGGTMVFIIASLLAQRYLLSFVAVRIDAAGLDFITRRLLALPMSYFATRRTGDLQRRIEGVRQIRDLLVQHGIAGVTAVAQLAVTVVLMAVYSPCAHRRVPADAPLYALLMFVAVRWLRPTFYELEDSLRPVPLVSGRRDQGHRDGEGGRRRADVPPPDARPVPGRRRTSCFAPTSRS